MATYYWRGSTGSFFLAAGWMVANGSGVLSAATVPPGSGDTVVFDTTGMTLSADAGFAGLLQLGLTNGALNLGGHTLTLLNTAQLGGNPSRISGPGTLQTGAISAVPAAQGGGPAVQLGGGAVWSNSGLVVDAGVIDIGAAAGDIATVINQPGALFALGTDQAGQIAAATGGAASFINDGTLQKTGGTGLSSVTAPVTNAGIISATTGTLEVDGGGVLGGAIGGDAGTVRLGGTYALPAGSTGTVTFGSGAVLGAGSDGAAVLSGGGTLASSGVVQLLAAATAQLVLSGGASWSNAGSVAAAADLAFGSGGGTLLTQAGASLVFSGNAGIEVTGSGTDSLVNRGTLGRSGSGTSHIAAPVTDSGSIVIAGGTLELDAGGSIGGPVGGAGALVLAGGTTTLGTGAAIALGSLLIDNATLAVGGNASIACAISGSSGTLQINAGNLTLGGAVDSSQTIRFNGPAATLTVTDIAGFNPAAVIGFTAGDALQVVDSSTNIIPQLTELEALARAGILTSISLTDAGTPALALTPAQLMNDLDALARIMTPYLLASSVAWARDASGAFNTATLWSTGKLPDASSDVLINFPDQPTVTFSSGSQTLHTLTNAAGHFVLSGGTLQLGQLVNQAQLAWNGGSIALNGSDGSNSGMINAAGATLSVTASGQQISGFGSIANAGRLLVGGNGSLSLAAPLVNTGSVVLSQATLNLNAGGASSGDALTAGSGTLAFGGGTFTVTGGHYEVVNTAIGGGTLDVSAAAGADFRGLTLSAGGLALGGVAAAGLGALLQSGGTISGGGTLTAYAGASFIGGLQTGAGLTRLLGPSVMAALSLDGGRMLENDSVLSWSGGGILLGGGDSAAAAHTATLSNTGVLSIATDAVIGPAAGGSGTIVNTGLIAVAAGSGETDFDATLLNSGIVKLLSGTLSLNGGGSSTGVIAVDPAATLRFGAPVRGGPGGAFRILNSFYRVANTVVDNGTLDVSHAAGANFGNALSLADAGVLVLGSRATAAALNQSGRALLTGNGRLTVTGAAQFTGGVQSGTGTTALAGPTTLGGVLMLDGGRTLENDGTLVWNGGSIVLGSGDGTAATHTGTLLNAAGALLQIAASGSVLTQGGGAVVNAGTVLIAAGNGDAVFNAALSNGGTVLLQSGTLTLDQAVSGSGTFQLGAAAKLDVAGVVGGGESIRFLGGGGTLAVETTGSFAAPVSGFGSGDALDLGGLAFGASPGLNFSPGTGGGTLTVHDSTHSVAIGLIGGYATAGFQLAADGHGGVLVRYS